MSREAHLAPSSQAAVALGVGLLLSRSAQAQQRKLLVFLHAALKQRAFQAELQASLPGILVTTVGRPADFERALADGQDAVLTLPMLLSARGLEPKLQGLRAGAATEKVSLVAADTPPDPLRVQAVGALDLLGREGTTLHVHRLLGSTPKVERVTKVEDLLPLLQMQRVSAIVLPSRMFEEFKAASRLSLARLELQALVDLPAAASLTPSGKDVLLALRKLLPNTMKPLGVEAWR